MYQASGQDYYASQVDENAKKELGVYLTDINTNEKRHYDNEKITLDATLTAKNFALDDEDYVSEEINIYLSCGAYKSDKLYAKGKIYPKDNYIIKTYDLENVQCIFEPWQLEKGSYEIKFNAKFNFETHAYLKQYFVLKERLDSMRRNQIIKNDDGILAIMKIDDTDPIAQNSAAPVEIRSSDRINSLVKLDRENEISNLFAIELLNRWEGTIDKVKNLIIAVPEGIELDSTNCRFPMQLASTEEGYSIYELADANTVRLKNIDRNLEQSCGMVIKSSNIDKLLEPVEVTTRYIRMGAYYDYILEEKLNIVVSEINGFNIRILSSSSENNERAPLDSSSEPLCQARDTENIDSEINFKLIDVDTGNILEEGTENICRDIMCNHKFSNKYEKGTRLKCEAQTKAIGDSEPKKDNAYITVKNSPPEITKVEFNSNEVKKGDPLVCKVEVKDPDKTDIITVRFDFEDSNIASTEKECRGSCTVEIPTTSIETSQFKCSATANDGEDKSKTITGNVEIILGEET
jgi:hypothetical protein